VIAVFTFAEDYLIGVDYFYLYFGDEFEETLMGEMLKEYAFL
jgi:hypothetical protein